MSAGVTLVSKNPKKVAHSTKSLVLQSNSGKKISSVHILPLLLNEIVTKFRNNLWNEHLRENNRRFKRIVSHHGKLSN